MPSVGNLSLYYEGGAGGVGACFKRCFPLYVFFYGGERGGHSFMRLNMPWLSGNFELRQPLEIDTSKATTVRATVRYMACNELIACCRQFHGFPPLLGPAVGS